MPIFDYQCQACGHAFDELQKLSDAVLVDCPACNAPKLRKLLSAPNFKLKGAGWRNSPDPTPKKKPKFAHTFDSAVPHADHHSSSGQDHGHGHDKGHSHDHSHSHSHGDDHKH
jgi:putative FmdB family regulatory protein